jgi:hypothetical protein
MPVYFVLGAAVLTTIMVMAITKSVAIYGTRRHIVILLIVVFVIVNVLYRWRMGI